MYKKISIRFFIITFSWTWLFFTPLVFIGLDYLQEYRNTIVKFKDILMAIALFGPAIGAIISLYTLDGKNELKKYILSFLSIKFSWKIWIIFIFLVCINIFAWIIPECFGFPRLKTLLPCIFVLPIYWLINIFFGGGQEEIGWRGYIMPRLENKFGYLIGSLLLGIIWACWHIPFWFTPETFQSYISIFPYLLFTTGLSYIFSYVINLSDGKLLSGVIIHANINTFVALFPVGIMKKDEIQIRFWIFSVLLFIIGITIAIIRTIKNKNSPNVT